MLSRSRLHLYDSTFPARRTPYRQPMKVVGLSVSRSSEQPSCHTTVVKSPNPRPMSTGPTLTEPKQKPQVPPSQ
jgi:hypothetical protein